MTRIGIICLFCIVSLSGSVTVSAQDQLQSGFTNPPASAKARTWWHWIDGNVTKEGITADLEAMKRIGIQEAQIFNVGQGYPEGPATFMSPEWLECFRHAVAEAERLGLEIGFNNGAGWSASGGPWVAPEYAMQTVVYSETHLKGNQRFSDILPMPETKLGFYKDIAVFAFPTPKGDERIDGLELKSLSGHAFKSRLLPDGKQIDNSAIVKSKDIVNLTGKMSADGLLEWTVPAGEWTILRFGHTPTGTENRPAGKGGQGLECDKMSRAAVDAYWAGGIKPILDKLGPLVGKALTNCVIDSYEVGCDNWTTGFDKEFRKLRRYDCMAYLPALAGYYVESGEITERFLWDLRKTIGDLMATNYYGYFRELSNKHGMKFSVEPYGGPFDAFQVGATGNIVMSEFWVGRTEYIESPKLVSSIAHLNGNTIVGAESFTSTGGWLNHPATIKRIGDWVWSEGVNRFIYHSYTHQPWDIAPGVTFHMYGFDLNRHNTWWEQGRAYMDYVARSQFMLQQGRSAADVLVFTGESSPNDGILRRDIKALGYDYDQIGIDKMWSLTVKDGWICTPVGGAYRVLVLPETVWMTPELLRKIHELAKAGAIITGIKPEKSPSLEDYPDCDQQVARWAGELAWGDDCTRSDILVKGCVIRNASDEDILKAAALAPDFSGGTTGSDLNFIHRITDEADIYFVANPQKESRREDCAFRVTGKRPQLWNPKTGEIKDAPVWKEQGDGTTSVPVYFEEEGSVFLVFRKDGAVTEHIVDTKTELDPQEMKPLPGLEIVKAEYGTFLPDGMVDVTEIINNQIRNGNLTISASNDLTSSDPAAGSIKELRLEYEAGGEMRRAQAVENTQLTLPANDAADGRVTRAIYGKFAPEYEFLPPSLPIYDVSAKIAAMMDAKNYVIAVNDRLIGKSGSESEPKKELRMIYRAEEETHSISASQGREVNLAASTPEPELFAENSKLMWITPYPGKMTYVTSSGATKTIAVKSVPQPVELTGAWDINFPANLGAPARATFDRLISWTAYDDDGIRHFSGTATYRKQFTLSKELLKPGYSLELDLGSVRVMAEVIVNGKNLGVLWKAPFRVDLDGHVHEGVNELEVRITNLWPNRLIGDDRLPEDFEWGDWTLKSWPDWLVNHTARSSERVTFTTWKHWNKDSELQTSGLLGPVYIRPYACIEVLDGMK